TTAGRYLARNARNTTRGAVRGAGGVTTGWILTGDPDRGAVAPRLSPRPGSRRVGGGDGRGIDAARTGTPGGAPSRRGTRRVVGRRLSDHVVHRRRRARRRRRTARPAWAAKAQVRRH